MAEQLVPIQLRPGIYDIPRDMAEYLVSKEYAACIGGSPPEPDAAVRVQPETAMKASAKPSKRKDKSHASAT